MPTLRNWLRSVHRGEAGEGVISTGIAVLIVAIIGAAMYTAFKLTFTQVVSDIDSQVEVIK